MNTCFGTKVVNTEPAKDLVLSMCVNKGTINHVGIYFFHGIVSTQLNGIVGSHDIFYTSV